MKIILCGVPDTGKKDLANILMNKYDLKGTGDIDIVNQVFENAAVGFLIDYRTELFLATARCMEHLNGDNIVFMHSLIDSLAYATAIVSIKIGNNDSDLDQWLSVYQFLPNLLKDSFLYDLVIRFPYEGEDEMLQMLDNNFIAVLETFDIPYILSSKKDKIFEILDKEYNVTK